MEIQNYENISFREINFKCNNNVAGLQLTVSKLDGKPENTSAVPNSPYRYVEVTHENLDDCDPGDIQVTSTLLKDELAEMLQTSESEVVEELDKVSLYRYAEGWGEAPTKKINESGGELDYLSQLDGFSYLAIAVKEVKQDEEGRSSCPFECCKDMDQYKDKECSEKKVCEDNQCILEEGERGNETRQGKGEKGQDNEGGFGTLQESLIALMEYTAMVMFVTLLLYIGVSYYLKRGSGRGKYGVGFYEEALPTEEEPGGSAELGKISDHGGTAYFDLDQLKKHVMVSGATGSGKTVTAQVIAEEALEQGKNVIVLDPTAQWSGFLRKNETDSMLEKYSEFGMDEEEDARSYNGNIRAINSPEEDIDIQEILQSEEDSGEIVVFSLHKLEHKDIARFLNSMIEQVFDANMEEKDHLDTLIVLD
ncbi:MAG: helicase HerA-like domain-containing protein, partial [Candidatus Nanohaloarchaea archaeon]|nr:helicase HerA-like domain-containing protein [Candidatus Nanohaloarchaea archaeon]